MLAILLLAAACGGGGTSASDDAGDATSDAAGGGADATDTDETSADSAAGEPVALKVGLSSGALTSHMYFVAETLGYYEEEGLDVELIPTEGSSVVAQQLSAGNFDIGQGGADVMMAAMQTVPLYPFYGALREYRDWIVPADSDIQSIADLEGTVLGVSNLSGGEVPVGKYLLEQNGIPEHSVELVAAGETPAALAVAIEQDRIQSFLGAQSGIVPFKLQSGIEVRSIFPEDFADAPVEYFFATEDAQSDPDVLVRFGRASAKGGLFCQTDPNACLNVVQQDHPELVEDREIAEAVLDLYLELSRPNDEGVFGELEVDDLQQYLDIFSAGEEPLIADPAAVMLDERVITDLIPEINDFDHDAVIAQTQEHQ